MSARLLAVLALSLAAGAARADDTVEAPPDASPTVTAADAYMKGLGLNGGSFSPSPLPGAGGVKKGDEAAVKEPVVDRPAPVVRANLPSRAAAAPPRAAPVADAAPASGPGATAAAGPSSVAPAGDGAPGGSGGGGSSPSAATVAAMEARRDAARGAAAMGRAGRMAEQLKTAAGDPGALGPSTPGGGSSIPRDSAPPPARTAERGPERAVETPRALERRPDFFSVVPKPRYEDVKSAVAAGGESSRPEFRHLGVSAGARDLVWSRSCDRVSGECNKHAVEPSYKKGQEVAPETVRDVAAQSDERAASEAEQAEEEARLDAFLKAQREAAEGGGAGRAMSAPKAARRGWLDALIRAAGFPVPDADEVASVAVGSMDAGEDAAPGAAARGLRTREPGAPGGAPARRRAFGGLAGAAAAAALFLLLRRRAGGDPQG